MTTIINAIASELESLNATHPACAAFGSTFTATNLFLGYGQAVEYVPLSFLINNLGYLNIKNFLIL